MNYLSLVMAIAAAVGLSACDTAPKAVAYKQPTFEEAADSEFIKSSRDAVTRLIAGIDTRLTSPVLIATVVDVNDLRQAAPLGRTLSEQYAAGLVAGGFHVKELKLRGDVFVKEKTGELLLSREVKEIAQVHNATTVLVGTYSVANQFTFVSLKLVNTTSGQILRAHDYALPNNQDVRALSRPS